MFLDLDVKKSSGYHKQILATTDINKCVKVIMDSSLFHVELGRFYDSFPKMKQKFLSDLDVKQLKVWMKDHIKKLK